MDVHAKLQDAVKRRKTLENDLQKLQGKLEVARNNLSSLEEECREKDIDPESLDEKIEVLTTQYENSVEEFVKNINLLETKLMKFKGV